MPARQFALAALLLVASVATADDKAARVLKLQQEIVETEKKLAAMKKQLIQEGEPTEFKKAAEPLYSTGTLTIGTEAAFAPMVSEVTQVVDDDTIVIKVSEKPFAPFAVIRGVPTKNITKGMWVTAAGNWRVVGTDKVGGRPVFVLRPTDGKFTEMPRPKAAAAGPGGPGGPDPKK